MLTKNSFFAVLLLAIFLSPAVAQNVAINGDGSPPDPNAMLDIQSSNKGLLIPRISTSARLAIPNTKGLLVYDTTTSAFWYNTGAGWQTLGTGTSGWGLTGNAIDSTHFIGPSNNMPFVVKINGKLAGMVDPFVNNVVWGTNTGLQPLPAPDIPPPNIVRARANTAVGMSAMGYNHLGSYNTAIGESALFNNKEGNGNTAIGSSALTQNAYGNANTAVGSGTLYRNQKGSYNTAIGSGASTGYDSIFNATAIGAEAIADASNKIRLGNSAVTVIEGQVPFTTPSDGRFKFDVQEDVKGLDFIRQLRPVTYHFDVERFEKAVTGPTDPSLGAPANHVMQAAYKTASLIRRSGFIAQEVEQAAQASGYDFSGIIRPPSEQGHYSLSYESFVVPLVKAVQEQQRQIELLKQEVTELKQQLSRKK